MKIGMTGGIGCGKSTAVRIFAEQGFRTVESDQIARDLLAQDDSVRSAVLDRWGTAISNPDGRLDRKAIAKKVFANPDELSWLENLLHPRVRSSWEIFLAEMPEAESLVEIPLLFEKRLETAFDFNVCVACPDAVVESRMNNRGYSRDEIDQRRRNQLPLLEKIDRADFVISNAGSLEFLKQQILRLIQYLRHSSGG